MGVGLRIRALSEADLTHARGVHRKAFGTFLGIQPEKFRPGADCLGPRWRMWENGGVVALDGDRLVGSGLLMHWGTGCILGPLTVDPDSWGRGVARQLAGAMMEIIDAAQFEWTGLFTHPQSPMHVRLYEEFGFSMQRITAVQSKAVSRAVPLASSALFSTLREAEKMRCLSSLRALSDRVWPGLDWCREVQSVDAEKLGDTALLWSGDQLDGFAVIHAGEGSEASEKEALVKVSAIRHGVGGGKRFFHLLGLIDAAAVHLDLTKVVAGTNTGRHEAYRMMRAHGYRTEVNGVAMFRPAADIYNQPGKFVIDDWR